MDDTTQGSKWCCLAGRELSKNVCTEPHAWNACPSIVQDGYAVLSTDGPGEYDVAFEAFAGVAPRTLSPGTVAYIGTGGPLPEGADAGLHQGSFDGTWSQCLTGPMAQP